MNESEDRYLDAQSDAGRYRLLLHAITDYAIFMLEPNGIVSSWNPGAERFKGYAASEIIGRHFSRFYTEEDRAAGIPDRALDTATTEGRFESEGWRVRKDGTRFWASVVIDPIWEPSGKLAGFAKVTRDLTERKAAEYALRRSDEQFRLLVHGVTDYAIYTLDPEGYITSWNAGAERIKGYLPKEILGEHFSRFYTSEDRESGLPYKALERALREGGWESEGWRVRKDGSQFWAHVVVDRILDESGQVAGFAKVTRDDTKRREAQHELDKARQALFQSQKMEAVGQLTAGVAHDFNNLLMAILGSLELIQKRVPPDPKVASLLDNAIQAADRGAALTKRMLAFARKQELALRPVDIPSTVDRMVTLLRRGMRSNICIGVRFPASMPLAHTDPSQLETALLNLAVNARDAMPQGGDITIGGRFERVGPGDPDLAPGDYICLFVADTGEGMDETTLARAAEPFFTTKGMGKGTGLGLSMVHGLAAQSGGHLSLKSQKGEGTTVELWLPAVTAGSASLREEKKSLGNGKAVRPLEILAVDDDSLVLTNTAAMLEDLGHRVLQAASGDEALELFKKHSGFDLIITDQIMPRMTGIELAHAIRDVCPRVPIIIATGYSESSSGNGADLPSLSKPFNQDQLASAVASAVGESTPSSSC